MSTGEAGPNHSPNSNAPGAHLLDLCLASLEADAITEENGRLALSVFDFSQNLVERWRGSNSAVKREILDCVSLNRAVSDVSLCVEKRQPFDYLAERPFLKIGRGDCTKSERDFILPLLQPFLKPPEQHLLRVGLLAASA